MIEEQKHQNEKPNHIQAELTQLSTKPTKQQRLKDIEDLLNAHLKRGEPKEPTPDECCGNGCSPCVWDTYYSKLDVYMDKRDQLESKKVEIEEEESD
ncbi:hypothetical protein FGO68_gene13514 [Halteria grandinella]|uniref:Oxidoreductase-like domain-containing protein n=1 Tax=Halteria grandinella TaxID=5974 RepID=A0A8J8SV25_HALGN|nr:hypothetical protein FGO68_gene13514 [Halteria grandinella]